jgi:hypothetical protein
MRSRRGKAPASPEAIARLRAEARAAAANPATWGVDAKALRLPAQANVATRIGPRGEVTRAHRRDIFDRLQARGALSEAAVATVRRLQKDMAQLHRTGLGVRDFAPRVDAQAEPGAFAEARLRAGQRVRAALDLAGPVSARLLRSLCEAPAILGQSLDWRTVVEIETGERLPDAQGAALRAATENLAGAYRLIDRARRGAAQP